MMMKKTLLVAAAALFASVTFAQEGIITNKKGTPILPQAGDYAIGVDATPFLEYFGNMFNGENFNAAPGFQYNTDRPFSIYAKQFISSTEAYRLTARIGFGNTKIEL